jgi:hypothetical protein
MKNLKLALVSVVLLCAVTVFSNSTDIKSKKNCDSKITKISLAEAIKDPGLVWTMYNQLDDSFLKNEFNGIHVEGVTYNNSQYLIYGTHEQWVLFFLMDYTGPKSDINCAKPGIHQRTLRAND